MAANVTQASGNRWKAISSVPAAWCRDRCAVRRTERGEGFVQQHVELALAPQVQRLDALELVARQHPAELREPRDLVTHVEIAGHRRVPALASDAVERADQCSRTQALQRARAGPTRHRESLFGPSALEQERDVALCRPGMRGDERLASLVHGHTKETLVEQALGFRIGAERILGALEFLIRERLAHDGAPDCVGRSSRLSQLAQLTGQAERGRCVAARERESRLDIE